MASNPIARLVAELGFRVNRTGLNQFQKDLKNTAKQINSTTGNSVGGATKKATKQQQEFFRKVTQGTAAIKPGLKETWKNLDRIKAGFRSGQLTQEQFNDARRRSLARISQLHKKQHADRMKQLRAQELAARRATRAAGDPRQVGNHRLISALHSDTGLGLMVGGFAAAQSSRSFQEFVGMEQGLTAATGSTERAAEEMEFLIDLSQRLGLFVGDLGRSFSSFAAAAKGSTLSSQEVRDTFEGISSQARVLNLSAADTQGVMRSLTQMMNKGTIMAEELKNQMGRLFAHLKLI